MRGAFLGPLQAAEVPALRDMAYTLQTGREPMAARLAVIDRWDVRLAADELRNRA